MVAIVLLYFLWYGMFTSLRLTKRNLEERLRVRKRGMDMFMYSMSQGEGELAYTYHVAYR